MGHKAPFIYLCAVLIDFLIFFFLILFQPLKNIKTNNKEFKYKNYLKYLHNKKKQANKNKENKTGSNYG